MSKPNQTRSTALSKHTTDEVYNQMSSVKISGFAETYIAKNYHGDCVRPLQESRDCEAAFIIIIIVCIMHSKHKITHTSLDVSRSAVVDLSDALVSEWRQISAARFPKIWLKV